MLEAHLEFDVLLLIFNSPPTGCWLHHPHPLPLAQPLPVYNQVGQLLLPSETRALLQWR